jgi:hypothetical protein
MIDEKPIKDWSDLSALIRQYFKEGWIFRGVRESHYDLIPRVGRREARKSADGVALPYSLEDERRVLHQLSREAMPPWAPMTELNWMVFGQHHSLPTRLLDWSENLLVAAFFGSSLV